MPRGKRRSKLRVFAERVVSGLDAKVVIGVLTACFGGGAIVHNNNEIKDARAESRSADSAQRVVWQARSRARDARIDSLSIRVRGLERTVQRYRGQRGGRWRPDTVYVAPAVKPRTGVRRFLDLINPFHAERPR